MDPGQECLSSALSLTARIFLDFLEGRTLWFVPDGVSAWSLLRWVLLGPDGSLIRSGTNESFVDGRCHDLCSHRPCYPHRALVYQNGWRSLVWLGNMDTCHDVGEGFSMNPRSSECLKQARTSQPTFTPAERLCWR